MVTSAQPGRMTHYGLRTADDELVTPRVRGVTRRGSILILVVWVILLLSFLTVGLASRSTFALGLTDRLVHQLQASYLALAGVQYTLKVLARDPTPDYDGLNEEWWNNASVFGTQLLGTGRFTIGISTKGRHTFETLGITDEERKLNLNTMPVEVLQRLLQVAGGVMDVEAAALANAIVDWRDEDQEPGKGGAEDFYYLGRNPAYECKDDDFENLEELLLVKGMTPELFMRLSPFLTVYGSGQLNVNTASETVLRAIGLSEQGIEGLLFYRYGEDDEEGTSDDRVLISTTAISAEMAEYVPIEDLNRLEELNQDGLLTVASETFSLSVVAETTKALSRTELACIIDRTGQVQAWTER